MNKFIVFSFALFSLLCKSQTKAITEDGKEVILLEDKTWKYVNESDQDLIETISTNDQLFQKSKDATFFAKSKKIEAGFYYNGKNWKIAKTDLNTPTFEYFFTNSNPTLYGIIVSENAPIQTLKNLKEILLVGIERNADYFRLKESEYRTVNGIKVLFLHYSVNKQGIDFEYLGNYYLTNDGYYNVTAYTFENNFDENKKIMENFINGITIKENKEVKNQVIVSEPPLPMPQKK